MNLTEKFCRGTPARSMEDAKLLVAESEKNPEILVGTDRESLGEIRVGLEALRRAVKEMDARLCQLTKRVEEAESVKLRVSNDIAGSSLTHQLQEIFDRVHRLENRGMIR